MPPDGDHGHSQSAERIDPGAIGRARTGQTDDRDLMPRRERFDQAVKHQRATGGGSRVGQQRGRQKDAHAS